MIASTVLKKSIELNFANFFLIGNKKLCLLSLLLGLITLPIFLIGKPLISDNSTLMCSRYVNLKTSPLTDTLLDNFDSVIKNTTEPAVLIKGTIWDVNGNTLQSVRVIPLSFGIENTDIRTREDGQFQFELIRSNDYKIIPFKNDNILNGVNADDLMLIKKHILGTEPFYSPYQLIAADVNDSGTVTVFDIVQIQRIILSINTEFEGNTSWRFIEATYPFLGDNPLVENYPEVCELYSLERNRIMNFVGIKIGDINGDARPNNLIISEYKTNRK